MGKCDKCGNDVPPENDVILYEYALTGDPLFLLATPRHLLPVKEGDQLICEGSPSRAQYLPGQPLDQRGSYPYDPAHEPLARAAYERLLLADHT